MGEKRAWSREWGDNKEPKNKATKHDEGQTARHNEIGDEDSSDDPPPFTPPPIPHQHSLDSVDQTPNSGIDLSPQDPSPDCIAKQLKYGPDSKAIKASVETNNNGEYIVKLTRVSITAATDHQNAVTAAEQAQTIAFLLSHAEMFRALGENLLSQYRASSEEVFYKSLDLQATPRS